MESVDYAYIFEDISSTYRRVELTDFQRTKKYQFQVSVDDSQFNLQVNTPLSHELADLVDVAVAVAVVDRLSFRKENTRTKIHITLPIRHPETFAAPQTIKLLRDVLYWFTNDWWFFEFTQRTSSERPTVIQLRMPIVERSKQANEVALWSGGLDSLAGLCEQLVAKPSTKFTLLGTGINEQVFSTQRVVAEQVRRRFPNRIKLVQVPIRSRNVAKEIRKNARPNARGFVFTLVGAVCALLEGQNSLYIYENGVGAINLPFSESAVGLDHLRPVHPLSLQRMSELVTQITGGNFTYQNQFLFKTKAQMCKTFVDTDTTDLIFHTVTCNRQHRIPNASQCGFCAACLLRKQALAVQGIEDLTEYVVPYHKAFAPDDSEYLKYILHHVKDLQSLFGKPEPWREISCSKYSRLSDIADAIAKSEGVASKKVQVSLIQLYRCYTEEWNAVKDIVEQDLRSVPEKRINLLEQAQYTLF